MTVLKWVWYLFAFFYVFWAPGYVLGKLLFPREALTVRVMGGLVLSCIVLPVFCFGLAMALGTNISEVMLFSVASAVLVVGMVVQLVRLRSRPGALEE